MIKKLAEIFSGKENQNLTSVQQDQVRREIMLMNRRRMIIFSVLTMVLELSLIVIHDVRYLLEKNGEINILVSYLVFHSMIFLLGAFVLTMFLVYKNKYEKNVYRWIVEVTTVIGMLCIAGIGVLDLYTIGTITSYTTIQVVFGVIILIKPPRNYLVYTIPHVLFLGCVLYVEKNPNLLMDTVVNSTMYYFCVLLISKILYENHVSSLERNIVLEEANKKLEHLSNFDYLTNLYNRRHFEDLLKSQFRDDTYFMDKNSVMVIMDIDHFKHVNDVYGHKAGDEVLKEVAEILKRSLSSGNMIARWGGEEFIMFFPETFPKQVEKVADNIRTTIEQTEVIFNHQKICVTASFGMTMIHGNDDFSITEGFKHADEALYLAKDNGRNRIERIGY